GAGSGVCGAHCRGLRSGDGGARSSAGALEFRRGAPARAPVERRARNARRLVADEGATDLTLYRRLVEEARPYWVHVAGLLALSLLSAPIKLLTPLPLKIAVDSVIGSRPAPAILVGLLPSACTHSSTDLLLFIGCL